MWGGVAGSWRRGLCRPKWCRGARAQATASSMRAVVLPSTGPADALELRTVPVRPAGTGEITVRVDACAVAYRDTLDRSGAFPFIEPDAILGHELAGTVVDGGADAPTNGICNGDRVVSLHWSQTESWPAYAEYCTAPAGAFVRVPNPDRWTAVEAAPVMSTFGTVWEGAVVRAGLRAEETVLVTGASGGVGSAAVTLCKQIGCRVIAVTSKNSKANFVAELGADEVIVTEATGANFNQHDAVRECADGGVDMVLECVGSPTFQTSLRSLRPEGRLVLVGNVDNAVGSTPLGLVILKSLRIQGSDSISASGLSDLFHFLDGSRRSQMCAGTTNSHQLRPMIHSVLPLEQVADAHRLLESQAITGRIVLQVSLREIH